MIVTAILVSHDGARWLPAVLAGLERQSRRPERIVAIDTGSRDGSADLLRASLGDQQVHDTRASISFPEAITQALAHAPSRAPADAAGESGEVDEGAADDEWLWLLHDDANPAADALEQLLAAAQAHPEASILGPKLREWPSLRRLLEVGLTITGTGHRETGLERGEYDQGQHDDVRRVLAVNTAGMLVRRSAYDALGGLDPELPVFGNDIDFGWRAAQAGMTTLVVPQAVMFHAEAAHRGIRRTHLTGRHTHFQERRAALFTSLVNVSSRRFLWQYVRLFFGSLLRMLGFLLLRSVGEALDELAATLSVHGRPRQLLAARRDRKNRRAGEPEDVRSLLAPTWLPYRHGLDFVTDLVGALSNQAQDVAERRRAARLESAPPAAARPVAERREEDEEEQYLSDSGFVARFVTNPIALTLSLAVILGLVAARDALGAVVGGGLSPTPESIGSWWSLHVESWHRLGTGTAVPAPAYVLPFALMGTVLWGSPGAVVSGLMWLGAPIAGWGAWRLLKVLGHLQSPEGLPRAALAWGAITYALVPATSGAWGEGRFGTVAVAALLPWTVHAALGLADPESDRRWRAAWRTALLIALSTAFVPSVWLVALLAGGVLLALARAIAPSLLKQRDAWGPPVLAVLAPAILLVPWLLPLITTGAAQGMLLEAGRLTDDQMSFTGLLTGRLGSLGAPWWIGAVLGGLAVVALLRPATRIMVLACWVIALATAVVAGALSLAPLHLAAVQTRPSLALFAVLLQALAVIAAAMAGGGVVKWWASGRPLLRIGAATLAAVALVVPVAGLTWWLSGPDDALATERPAVVPVYMEQSSLLGPEHGILVLSGSIEEGVDYRIRRGDGVTVGEDEILLLAPQDPKFRDEIESLVSAPTAGIVAALGDRGIEYIVLTEPADGHIAANLDATAGLEQASAENRATRAWRVDRPLATNAAGGPSSWVRPILLLVQAFALIGAVVMALPTLRGRRRDA